MATEPQTDRGGLAYSGLNAHLRSSENIHRDIAVNSPDQESAGDDESITIILDISPELHEAMEDMATDLRGSKSEVFVRAMSLFQLAMDAKKAGKRVCIADDDLIVETEITGFGPLDDEPETGAIPIQE